MALSITILQPASLTATVDGASILAAVVGSSATLNVDVGVPGPAATVQVGTTTTGEAGTDADVVNVGTLSAAILDFTIPRGDQGEQGPQGVPGQAGQTGPKGDKGDTGSPGVGVPTGGSAGQVLAKIDGTNYNTEWIDGGSGGDYLPLTGGTLTGSLVLSDDVFASGVSKTISANAIDGDSYTGYEIGSDNAPVAQGSALKIKFGNTGEEYEKQAILQYNGLTFREAISGTTFASYGEGGVTFPDATVQTTAALPLTGGTMSGDGAFITLGSVGAGNATIELAPDEGRAEFTNLRVVLAGNENSYLQFPDATTQVTAGLPLTGGTMVNNSTILVSTTPDIDNQGTKSTFNSNGLSAIYYTGSEDTTKTNYGHSSIDHTVFDNPQNFHLNQNGVYGIGDGEVSWGVGINGLTFPDSTTQTTAGLPLTGGTLTGGLTISGGDLDMYGHNITNVPNGNFGQITFQDDSIQTTAFPPSGGTTAQYIDGTGALQEFPTVTSVGKIVTSVRNNTGATLTKGTVVYINGAVGNKPTVTKAQANSESTSKATYGFVESGIANNADGNIVVIGLLENIDTQGFTDGTQIYLSPTVAGGWTSTQPFSPYHYVRLGTVIRGNHPTQGSIEVSIINGFQLDEMSDVGATSPTNNNVLTWVSASSQWLDRSITTILGYTPANVANYAYATTAQAQAGTSTTTVISPATLLDAKYFQGGRNLSLVAWLASTSGTGAGSVTNQNRRDVGSPTTAIGYGASYLFLSNATRGSSVTSSFNWSKRIQFGARLNRNVASPDANTVFRFSIGKSTQAGGDLAERGIMVKQTAGGALQLLVHNGTTLTTVSSSFSPVYQQAYDLMVVSDGAGNATLFVNDVSVATTTGSPTSGGSINTHQINFTAENTAIISGSGMAYQVSDISFQQNL